jgi:hypothetical protein
MPGVGLITALYIVSLLLAGMVKMIGIDVINLYYIVRH